MCVCRSRGLKECAEPVSLFPQLYQPSSRDISTSVVEALGGRSAALPVCQQIGREGKVQLARSHAAAVLNGVDRAE